MTFQLSRQPRGETSTRFHVLASDNSICGIITVENSDADDLERHWLASSPAPARAAVGKHQNPMIAAMLAAAPRNRFTREAILRGCA